MKLRQKIYPKSISDALVTTFMFLIIPAIYYFELWVVLPKFHQPWGFAYLFHFVTGNFILFNVTSNLIAIILIDTSINRVILQSDGGPNWRLCSVCVTLAPPRSWHCPTCDVCILKRDHHCMFTSCCIGHHNHRFFLVFVFYLFVATVYSTFFNLRFVYTYIRFDSWLSIVKIVFPFATLFLEWTENQLYVTFIIIVTLGCLFTGVLLVYHLKLILNGLVTHERNEKLSIYDQGKLWNLKCVLGNNWKFVWLSPFVLSELPCDGVSWITNHSVKGK